MKYTEEHTMRFFTPIELGEIIKTELCQGLTKKDINELQYCSPLLVHLILKTGKRMSIGKIPQQDHPFDVLIVEETLQHNAINRDFKINNPLSIQLKEIRKGKDVTTRVPIEEWFDLTQEQINKAFRNSPSIPGILHLCNIQPIEDVGEEFQDILKRLKIENSPYSQIIFSIEIEKENNSTESEVLSWQLYPTYAPVGSYSNEEIEKIKKIYNIKSE